MMSKYYTVDLTFEEIDYILTIMYMTHETKREKFLKNLRLKLLKVMVGKSDE